MVSEPFHFITLNLLLKTLSQTVAHILSPKFFPFQYISAPLFIKETLSPVLKALLPTGFAYLKDLCKLSSYPGQPPTEVGSAGPTEAQVGRIRPPVLVLPQHTLNTNTRPNSTVLQVCADSRWPAQKLMMNNNIFIF